MGDITPSAYHNYKRSESADIDISSHLSYSPPNGSSTTLGYPDIKEEDDLDGLEDGGGSDKGGPGSGSVNGSGGPSKKKARSRTISSLTAEQLARKRAHDRDAQRAIRTRTKNQITTLEIRVKELENEKQEWEFKTSELKKELENALEALDTIKRNGIQHQLASGGGGGGPGSIAGTVMSKSPVSVRAEPVCNPGYAETEQSCDNIAVSNGGKENCTAMSLDFVCHSGGTGFKPNPNGYRQIQDSPYEFTARKRSLVDLASSASSDVSDLRRRISGAQSLLTSSPASTIYSIPSVQYPGTYCVRANGHWEVMPRHLPPTCILDRVFLEFLEEMAKQHRIEGTPLSALAGPPSPDITYIVDPSLRAGGPISKLTAAMVGIVETFGDLVLFPERVAITYIMYIWMRWAINPTRDNYDHMPEFIKPRPSQLFTARPIWFDLMPWPMTRDIMARHPEKYVNDEFSIPYTQTLSVNWPYPTATTVIKQENGEYVLNPMFEAHLRDLENWTLGSKFAELYPDLQDHLKINDHPPGKTLI